jgi:hypothetical protein
MPRLENPSERQRGYARERERDDLEEPQRQRPRLGGDAPLPGSGAAAELFVVPVTDLSIAERAAAGWCVRLGVPEPVPGTGQYDMHELLVELTVLVGGTTHTLEVNAFPGCTVHLVGEQISARMKWATAPVVVPPASVLRWQLSRGLCPTTGVRGYSIQAPGVGLVPPFATGFALFSGDNDISEDIQLDFATHTSATRVLQHYTREDLLQTIAAFAPLPPGAGEWRWVTETASPMRLVFCLGEQI